MQQVQQEHVTCHAGLCHVSQYTCHVSRDSPVMSLWALLVEHASAAVMMMVVTSHVTRVLFTRVIVIDIQVS